MGNLSGKESYGIILSRYLEFMYYQMEKERKNMLRIAICDDEVNARDLLWMKLEKILEEEKEQIVYDFSTGTGAVNWLKKHPGEIDLLFLDVEMKKAGGTEEMNGMEAAKAIRRFDQNLLIVFVTGYADYVFDGYSVGAMDYLMKPVDDEKLRAVINRAREKLGQEDAQTFLVKNTEGTYRFPYKEILFFYSDKRKVILVTKQGEYPFYDKLDQVENKINSGREKTGFVRIHQRYLVNGNKINQITVHHVKIGETILPISRSLREQATLELAKILL